MQNKTEWIKSQLLPKESANQTTSRLNTPIELENPIEPTKIPAPISLVKIREAVSDEEAFKIINLLIYDKILEAINNNDLIAVQYHMKALYAGGVISDQTVEKLTKFLSETIIDPNYNSTIIASLASVAGYDPILVHEVQEVLDNNKILI